jgi:DNA helicase-2/ATP-dependent DNA helicase PcrA
MEFKSVIADYEKSTEDSSIDEFMVQLALTAEVDNYDDGQTSCAMMTMHSAKGLEFPVVFMPGMEDGLFPGSRAFDDPASMEEERRLCYVGMTRAEELLFMTSAELRMRYGRTDYTRESQFLKEIDRKLMTGDAVYQPKKSASPGVPTGSRDGYARKPYKPFDALKYTRMDTHRKSRGASADLAQGDRVSHSKFGEGLVIESVGSIVTVAFDSVGIKKLAKDVAPLEKL